MILTKLSLYLLLYNMQSEKNWNLLQNSLNFFHMNEFENPGIIL